MHDFTKDQAALLRWLGRSEYSQYGECCGLSLDMLIAHGLAEVHGPLEHQEGFISRGKGMMYRAVSLTETGRAALAELHADAREG